MSFSHAFVGASVIPAAPGLSTVNVLVRDTRGMAIAGVQLYAFSDLHSGEPTTSDAMGRVRLSVIPSEDDEVVLASPAVAAEHWKASYLIRDVIQVERNDLVAPPEPQSGPPSARLLDTQVLSTTKGESWTDFAKRTGVELEVVMQLNEQLTREQQSASAPQSLQTEVLAPAPFRRRISLKRTLNFVIIVDLLSTRGGSPTEVGTGSVGMSSDIGGLEEG